MIDLSGPLSNYGAGSSDASLLVEWALQFEQMYRTTITDLLQADRHLGRGYYYSGGGHPRSLLSDRSEYWASVALIRDLATEFSGVLRRTRARSVILSGVASLPTKLACVVARGEGVQVRVLANGRFGNSFYWAHDEFLQSSRLFFPSASGEDALEPLEVEALSGGYASTKRNQAAFRKNFTFLGAARRTGRLVAAELWGRTYRLAKGGRPKYGAYRFGSRVATQWRILWEHRKLKAVSKCRSDATRGYVFLPLHVEPEASLMVLSPEFNFQMVLIDLVAKAIPPDVELLVKEHTVGVGRRPVGFYAWLREMPNVRVAPLESDGAALARGSLLTVTITGTAGLEAAVAGVPVLSFGRHNLYNRLGHVHYCDQLGCLRDVVRGLIAVTEAERRHWAAEGQRFLKALQSMCVGLGDGSLREEGSAMILYKAYRETLPSDLSVRAS